jgi:hypothetical protein
LEKKPNITEKPPELEGIIQRILEIDAEARSITEAANNYRSEAEKNIILQKAALKKQYLDKAKKRIEVVASEEQRIADETFEISKENQRIKLEKLESDYKDNAERLTNEIYKRTITE